MKRVKVMKKKQEEVENEKPFWKELLGYLVLLAVILVVKTYVISPIRVNGISMVPTLEDKDYMILDKISYKFSKMKRFDIVVIKYDGEYLIKRLIGFPGEHIEYKNNKLYVNGTMIEENFTKEVINDYNITELGSKTIPKDHYFVIGDNRPVSKDSRIIGFVSKKDIIGKSSLTLLPFSRFGIKS